MNRYLCYCAQKLMAQNKLEKDYYKIIDRIDRTIIFERDMEAFQAAIFIEVDDLNKAHPRCKPLKVHFWDNAPYNDDLHLSDDHDRVSFALLKIKEDRV